MPYVTAVTDRGASDIANRTSKAFFNVADWERIYDNTEYVRGEIVTLFGPVIVFSDTISDPTVISIPDVTIFNILTQRIEQLRQVALAVMPELATTPSYGAIKHDWEAGIDKNVPTYKHVNQWERIIDVIHTMIVTYTNYRVRFPRTGIATTGAENTRLNMFRNY